MPVPTAYLLEEVDQVSRRAKFAADRSGQDAGGQRVDQAHDGRIFAERWALVLAAQDAGVLEGRQVSRHPGVGVRGQRTQVGGHRRIVQNARPQLECLGRLLLDEFLQRQRRGRPRDVKLEADEIVFDKRQWMAIAQIKVVEARRDAIQSFGSVV